ncbi:28S ribosomal protein S18c, mitochondrial isoform X2 [Phyllopteryx taeniolatus]|uniref:28S ribosomal protein S18c, mitochondrial isoform X2 n=1 Tax=Phyllopteryx taeniolatus TaxID=161469 RepID=UPI002AD2FC8F|nr:28S ribosomal protein S18c, mitochondrial isoform X2 [Phyllopteryx taeniolatus]
MTTTSGSLFIKMLLLNRPPRLLFCVFSRLRNASYPAASRSASASSDLQTQKHEHKHDQMLVKMENPYKEPQKGCVLCNVTVDFKNIQEGSTAATSQACVDANKKTFPKPSRRRTLWVSSPISFPTLTM